MKLITREWLERAREDLDVAIEIISKEHLTNMVAFHSQQAVEKTLKGIIEEFEIGLVKIYNLERLIGLATKKMDLNIDITIIRFLDRSGNHPNTFFRSRRTCFHKDLMNLLLVKLDNKRKIVAG